MRYALNDINLFPNIYLGYVDPTDNYSYSGIQTGQGKRAYSDIYELLRHIESRRDSLGYEPLPYLPETIQHYLYLIGDAPKSYFHPVKVSSKVGLSTFNEIKTGASLAASLSYGAISNVLTAGSYGWTTNKIAAERAEICYHCPENTQTTKSMLARVGAKALSIFSKSRSTPLDAELFDCGVCGCPLREKVHYSEEIVGEITPDEFKADDFPESFLSERNSKRYRCWVREILAKRDRGENLSDE